MYYDRVLSTAEALYVSRAQQRIAELTTLMADQYQRNDVDEFNAQICQELQYSILALKSTDLAWTDDEIQMVMDYYTIHAKLISFGFRSIIFNPLCAIAGGQVWATVQALNLVEYNSITYDQYLLSLINQIDIDYNEGDNILQIQIDNIIAGNSTLVAELTADITVGGIVAGTVFPIGTTFEALWNALLGTLPKVSNFTFDVYAPIIQVGVNMQITQFTWDSLGSPQNLVLNDSKGIFVNVPLTGNLHNGSWGYNWSINEDLTWTISGDNIEDVVINVGRRYLTYYGKEATANDTQVVMTETKVLAGTSSLQETVEEVTVTADTANGEQGFIAVQKSQTVGDYEKWFVDNTNFSDILVGEFITPPVDVTVSGTVYSVYRWGYRSPLIADLKLHR